MVITLKIPDTPGTPTKGTGTSVKTSVSEARLRWLTELIFQIGHSMGILECQRRPPGLQMLCRG